MNDLYFTASYIIGMEYPPKYNEGIEFIVEIKNSDLETPAKVIFEILTKKIKEVDDKAEKICFNTNEYPINDTQTIKNFILEKYQRIPIASSYNHDTKKWTCSPAEYNDKIKNKLVCGLVNTNQESNILYTRRIIKVELI